MTDHRYELVFKRPGYAFPPSATVAEIEQIVDARSSWFAEVMTDQVDVYAKSANYGPRKIATYMA